MSKRLLKIPTRLRALVLTVCLFLVLPACQSGTQPPDKKTADKSKPALSAEAMEHLTQGQKFLRDDKLDEALKEFQETVRLAPDSPVANFWLGRVHFYRKERDQAEKYFKKVLELEPENYHALAWLGKLYSFDRDRLEQARSYLIKSINESPENLEARFDLARVYAMMGERDKALREFAFIFSKERDFFIYHFELGRMFEAWEEKTRALEEYKRALYLNPNFTPAAEAIKRLESRSEGRGSEKAGTPPPTTPARR